MNPFLVEALRTYLDSLVNTGKDNYSAEVKGLDYRALEANIKRIETEQEKRSRLLADPDALRKEAESNGISVAKQRNLYQSNFDNNAPRLAAYKKLLPDTPKADTTGIVFRDVPVDADFIETEEVTAEPTILERASAESPFTEEAAAQVHAFSGQFRVAPTRRWINNYRRIPS